MKHACETNPICGQVKVNPVGSDAYPAKPREQILVN